MKLSAVVITKNEEKNIIRCLKSLRFCSEIIVVDAESTDATCELAGHYATKVVTRRWTSFSDQKNAANAFAGSTWILSIDADEEIPNSLRVEIEELLSGHAEHEAYTIARKTFHSGQWIRYGGWYPNRLVRLFKKESGIWIGDNLHEKWQTNGTIGHLKQPLLHHSFDNIADQVDRNNQYSTLGAIQLLQQGKHFSFFRLCWKPFVKFLETYVIKAGFLDGFTGFFISVSAAYSVFLKWAKLRELHGIGKS